MPLTSGFPCANQALPKPFKAQVVQECLQPGATLSSVAISPGINANVIRKWLPLYQDQPPAALPAFVPLRVTQKRQDAGSVHFVKQVSKTWPDVSSIRQLHPEKFPTQSGSSFVTPV
ncbi:transposase [Pseudomonas sp. HLT2-19-2]